MAVYNYLVEIINVIMNFLHTKLALWLRIGLMITGFLVRFALSAAHFPLNVYITLSP